MKQVMAEFADLGFKLILYQLQNEVWPNHCHGARSGLVYCDLESDHSLTILRVVFN